MREELQKWLEDNNMTQADFVRATGVKKSTVNALLKGTADPMQLGVSKALAIAELIGVSVEELFGQSEKITEPTPERKDLTDDENELLNLWRNATQESRSSVLMVLRCNQRPAKKEAEIS